MGNRLVQAARGALLFTSLASSGCGSQMADATPLPNGQPQAIVYDAKRKFVFASGSNGHLAICADRPSEGEGSAMEARPPHLKEHGHTKEHGEPKAHAAVKESGEGSEHSPEGGMTAEHAGNDTAATMDVALFRLCELSRNGALEPRDVLTLYERAITLISPPPPERGESAAGHQTSEQLQRVLAKLDELEGKMHELEARPKPAEAPRPAPRPGPSPMPHR